MLINYITLMLINLTAGLVLLASFVYEGFEHPNPKRWVPGFGMVGAIALSTGFHMIWHWPIRGSYNIAFGETTVLFGILFVGASLALALGWDLLTVAIYAFFAGVTAIVIGIRIIDLEMTRRPLISGLGFILTGLGGVCAAPALYWRTNRAFRLAGVGVLAIAAAIWAFTGYMAYWGHLEGSSNWVPPGMP
ncbi:DUF981 domain-containing protein [Trichocoleus sp. FACHB-591]|nr:DUF981 domain-containing protein [Trichocoleus sp. FACHB-591]